MENIIDLIVNNGIGVACIVYFMFRDYKFVNKINETLAVVEKYIATREEHIKKGGKEDDLR